MAPVRGTKPKVGRYPLVPQRVEGDEIEPRVSDPMAKPTHPDEVAEADPADERLEPCSSFHGFRVRAPNPLWAVCKGPPLSFSNGVPPRYRGRQAMVAS